MRREDFAPAMRRHVVRADGGYAAFVPPALPAPVQLSPVLVDLIASAERAVGRLAGVGGALPNPRLLGAAMVRREAVLSSRIEGTHATLSELALFEASDAAPGLPPDVREVSNYVRAMEHVLAPDRRLPLSVSLLREAHAILMDGVRGGALAPGEVRRTQNWIAPAGALLADAPYVPPPPERLWECLGALERHLHDPGQPMSLLRLAAIHYQFEAIHPFLDGNGRLGRLLVVQLLVEWGLLPGPILDLSAWIEPRRDRYYQLLLGVSVDGDWPAWYAFFLTGLAEQAVDAADRAGRLAALRDRYRATVSVPRASALLPVLVDRLFHVPALTIGQAQQVLGVTHRAATATIDRLTEAGILAEAPRRSHQRYFLAPGILAAIEGRPDPGAALPR